MHWIQQIRTCAYNSLRPVLLALVFISTSPVILPACTVSTTEETELFELAESRFRVGDHEGSLTLYNQFLLAHPTSPLADTARARIATINREWDAIMGRRGAPAPIYVSPFGAPPAEAPSEPAFEPITAPQLPVLQ